MSSRATIYGLLIGAIGFVLTRFTVTLAATDSTGQFLFAGIVPLVLGLSLTAFGIMLAVGAYDAAFVRTTAVWCVLGTVTMLALVVLTLLGSEPAVLMDMDAARERTYLSNFLIGGALGGTLTGLYAAQNRRHRTDLRQQANRLVLLNRLLRDRVINSATAIKGYTEMLEEAPDRSGEVIDSQADAVIETVENVKYLSETSDRAALTLGGIDLGETVETEVERARASHPEVSFDVTGTDADATVRANEQLGEVFHQLLRNAAEYSEGPEPEVSAVVSTATSTATVSITDEGTGLPRSQRALLEKGQIAEYDDPTTGFGLNIVRLLVESFDGRIETAVDDSGSTVDVILPLSGSRQQAGGEALSMPGVAPSRIGVAVGASLVAGAVMGLAMVQAGGDVPVIGALYGVQEVGVAAITHQFHSVVFGLTYAALLSALPARYTGTASRRILLGIGFGVLLWLVAAGLIMPVWLRLLGLSAAVPNLALPGFVGHVVWGVTLGSLYHAGDRWLAGLGSAEPGADREGVLDLGAGGRPPL